MLLNFCCAHMDKIFALASPISLFFGFVLVFCGNIVSAMLATMVGLMV